jgi:hypothetical protein
MNIFLTYKKLLVLLILAVIIAPLNIFAQNPMPVGVDSVVITFSNVPTQIEVEKAPLKYNKDFALSFQMDDAIADIYDIVYPLFEGTGNSDGLYYSNGCGDDISFKMSSGLNIFSAAYGSDLLDPYNPENTDKLTWTSINTLYQSGWGILNHGVFDNPRAGSDNERDYEIQRTQSYSRRKINDSFLIKTFIIPNGAMSFVDNVFGNNYHTVIDQESGSDWLNTEWGVNVENDYLYWLNPIKINRILDDGISVIERVDSLYSSSQVGVKKWISWGMHEYPDNYTADFQYIYNTYGSAGLDNVLITTDDDIVDYLAVKQETQLLTIQDGNKLTITFDGNIPADRLNYNLSLNVYSDQTISNIEVFGGESSSHSVLGNDTALINLSWDGRSYYSNEYLADSMTTVAVGSQTQYDAWVAMDYVILLENGTQKELLRNALCNISGVTYDEGFCLDCSIDLGPDITICKGECTTIVAPPDFDTYQWIVADTVFATTQSIEVCPDFTTQFILNVENDFCNTSDTLIVVVLPTPVFDLGNDFDLCLGDSVTIYGPDTTGLIYSFEWVVDGALFATSQDIRVSPLDTTHYFLNVTNDSGCIGSDSIWVNVLPIPIAEIIQTDTISSCFGDSVEFVVEGSGIESYLWNTTDTTQSIKVSPEVADSTYQFYVDVFNGFGCSVSDTVWLIVNSIPNFELAVDTTICFGQSLTIFGPDTTGLNYTFEWIVADTLFDTTQNIIVSPIDTTQYFLNIENENGCIGTDSIWVNILENPVAEIIQGDTLFACLGDSAEFTVEGTGIESYLWNTGDTTQSIKVSPEVSDTTYKYFVDVFNSNGCSVSDTAWLIVNSYPVVEMAEDTINTCFAELTTVSASVISSDIKYLIWTFNSDVDTNGTVKFYFPETSGTVYFDVQTNSGCNILDSTYIIVNPFPVIETSSDTEICLGDTTTLSVSGADMYYWILNEDTISTESNFEVYPEVSTKYFVIGKYESDCQSVDSVIVDVLSSPEVEIIYEGNNPACSNSLITLTASGADSYLWSTDETTEEILFPLEEEILIKLLGTSSDGCEDSDSLRILVIPTEDVSFSGLMPAYCENDPPSILTGVPIGGIFTGSGIVGSQFKPELAGAGEHMIKYTFVNASSCVGIDSISTTVYGSGIEIDLGEDQRINLGESIELDAGEGFDSYYWSTGSNYRNITIYYGDNPVGSVIKYVVIGVINGCTSQGEVNIIFADPFGIGENYQSKFVLFPNPNKGVFTLSYLDDVQNYKVFIYDYFGKLIFDEFIICDPDCKSEIELPELSTGLYIVKTVSEKGVSSGKLIVN